ncbi:MAG: hypothetical protein HYU81_00740 [Candidatus Brennerbacteria bacterium]|nr:hypothetical protein [Candidatus Brennerbacteria bacterium]
MEDQLARMHYLRALHRAKTAARILELLAQGNALKRFEAWDCGGKNGAAIKNRVATVFETSRTRVFIRLAHATSLRRISITLRCVGTGTRRIRWRKIHKLSSRNVFFWNASVDFFTKVYAEAVRSHFSC